MFFRTHPVSARKTRKQTQSLRGIPEDCSLPCRCESRRRAGKEALASAQQHTLALGVARRQPAHERRQTWGASVALEDVAERLSRLVAWEHSRKSWCGGNPGTGAAGSAAARKDWCTGTPASMDAERADAPLLLQQQPSRPILCGQSTQSETDMYLESVDNPLRVRQTST